VVTGNESDAQLRDLVMRFVAGCPAGHEHPGCPFRLLHGMYHGSLKAMLDRMTRSGMASLFEIELEARLRAWEAPPGAKPEP
jgi:hypothetical protein